MCLCVIPSKQYLWETNWPGNLVGAAVQLTGGEVTFTNSTPAICALSVLLSSSGGLVLLTSTPRKWVKFDGKIHVLLWWLSSSHSSVTINYWSVGCY